MDSMSFDVVIVGGGAAGLSAALVLGRSRRRVAVIDSGEPRNAAASHMQGFLSRDGMPPAELVAAGRAEVALYGVVVIAGRVVGAVVTEGRRFAASLADGRVLSARRILVAAGMVDEMPPVDGIPARWGKDLLHCPYCHGWEVRDQPLGVLASAPGSVTYAQLVRQLSDDVVFFAHTYELTVGERAELEARGIEVVAGAVSRLVVEADRLSGVQLVDGRVFPRSAVFVRPVNRPHAHELLAAWGCRFAEDGFVIADALGKAAAGVWVAGNVVDPRAQVITAAGQGSAAAIAINGDLVREDVERAVALVSGARPGGPA